MNIWHAFDFFFYICTNIEHIVALRLGYGMAWIGAGVMGLLLGLLYDTTPKSDPRKKDCTVKQRNTLHAVTAESFIGLFLSLLHLKLNFVVALSVHKDGMRASL